MEEARHVRIPQASLARMRDWLVERYGDVAQADWLAEHGPRPLLDRRRLRRRHVGARAVRDALAPACRYLGIDVSEAVDVAADRFAERGFEARLPAGATSPTCRCRDGSVDLDLLAKACCTTPDSTRGALAALARLLKPGGRFLFYVYRQEGAGPRVHRRLYPREARRRWRRSRPGRRCEPLTQLGIALGELGAEIDIPRADRPARHPGRADRRPAPLLLARRQDVLPARPRFDEMNHINYDWYAPANAARQSPEEVRAWCAESGLEIEREVVEEAGITIIARKAAG